MYKPKYINEQQIDALLRQMDFNIKYAIKTEKPCDFILYLNPYIFTGTIKLE